METNTVHRFEQAGLGRAPFTYVGMEKKTHGGGSAGPVKPGSSCDYCGTAIAYVFWVDSADGRRFKVGSDCIRKVDDHGLVRSIAADERKLKTEAKERADERKRARIGAALDLLATDRVRAALAAKPHPHAGMAADGRTALDWAEWMCGHAGVRGMLEVAKEIERLG